MSEFAATMLQNMQQLVQDFQAEHQKEMAQVREMLDHRQQRYTLERQSDDVLPSLPIHGP